MENRINSETFITFVHAEKSARRISADETPFTDISFVFSASFLYISTRPFGQGKFALVVIKKFDILETHFDGGAS